MSKKRKWVSAAVFACILVLLLVGIRLTEPEGGAHEPLRDVLRDAVMHEHDRVTLFGIAEVNPGLVSSFIVSGILILFSLIVRVFVIPRFVLVPGRFQFLLEKAVGFFGGLARQYSPRHHGFIGGYIFAMGLFICFSTLFELIGIRANTVHGSYVLLPAPFADINAALAIGILTYLIFLAGGAVLYGKQGAVHALKDFSVLFSLSFSLYAAVFIGGFLMEMAYHQKETSIVIPALIGALFTVKHSLIQAYLFSMMTASVFGKCTSHADAKDETYDNAWHPHIPF